MFNYRGLGNRAEEYAGKEEKEMKNWNKPEVEELDVRCTEAHGFNVTNESLAGPAGTVGGKSSWDYGK